MIILHRPPRHLFSQPGIAASEDVEICYESLQAIFRLMRSYSRFYRYQYLPLDFVHTLSVAASTILMKRCLDDAPWEEAKTSRSLALVLEAMNAVKETWPCVSEIEKIVTRASQAPSSGLPEMLNPMMDVGFMADWPVPSESSHKTVGWPAEAYGGDVSEADIGLLLTDKVLGGFPSSHPGFD